MCLLCNHSFGKPKRIYGKFFTFVKFHDFIVNKINKLALSEEIFLSRKSIWRKFKPFFGYKPISEESTFLLDRSGKDPWVLGIDGKWLRRQGVIMIYRDVTHKVNLYWSYHFSESYEAIEKDFEKFNVIIKDHLPSGVITDWKGALVSAANTYLPLTPHQRCLTHVKRSLLRFLPLRSPLLATQKLRKIAQEIIRVESFDDKIKWRKDLCGWIEEYKNLLKEKTIGVGTKKKWWYTHGNTRRAVKLLTFDEKHLFAYLDYPIIPRTNNSLEGSNSQIKTKLSNHRGMKTPQQVVYLFWLFTFKRVNNRRDLKKLWDSLKNKIYRL
ncbi:hypothetical protein BH10BAC1_BH10BAC1_18900 [soil metagenome]